MKSLVLILFFSFEAISCQETKIIYVGDHLVDCVGVAPQKCMIIKENRSDKWSNFYDKIQGFNYEEGYLYKIKVNIKKMKSPPEDGSSLKYTLLAILDKNKTQKQVHLNNNWKIIFLKGIEKLIINPTIKFDEKEKTVSGLAGCNNFFGKFKLESENISLGEMGMTRKICPDMIIENTFINNLKNVSTYKIEELKLRLYDKNDQIILVGELLN